MTTENAEQVLEVIKDYIVKGHPCGAHNTDETIDILEECEEGLIKVLKRISINDDYDLLASENANFAKYLKSKHLSDEQISNIAMCRKDIE